MEEGSWGGEASLGATPWLPGNRGRRCGPAPGLFSCPSAVSPRDCQKLECPWGYGEGRGFRVSARAEQEATCDPTRVARDASWRWGQARARGCRNAFLSQPPAHWVDGWRRGSRRARGLPRSRIQHPAPRAGGPQLRRWPAREGGGRISGQARISAHTCRGSGARRPAPVRRSVLQGRCGVPLCGVPEQVSLQRPPSASAPARRAFLARLGAPSGRSEGTPWKR